MKIVQVVPLRRFDATHWWFDYSVPDDQPIQLGQRVTIAFRKRLLAGVVWGLPASSSIARISPIEQIEDSPPVVTNWQRLVMETIARQTCSSLGHVVQSFVPTWPRRRSSLRKQLPKWKAARAKKTQTIQTRTLWYRQRSMAQEAAVDWLRFPSKVPRVVIVPTIEDGLEIQAGYAAAGGIVPLISSQLTPAQYRTLYIQILTGQVKRVIGTGFAAGLPFPMTPEFLIDQEEHPSHKTILQQPRFDVREVLREVQANIWATTPAPSLSLFAAEHPAPPSAPGHRHLWSFHEPGPIPWISYRANEALEHATPDQPIFLIAPQHGYASVMRCRDCGFIRNCPSCGATIRLFADRGQIAVCRACNRRLPEAVRCPTCRGTKWTFSGLGVERVRQMVSSVVPATSVGWLTDKRVALAIGTYADTRRLPDRNWQLMLVMTGDALLSWPDFSAAERAWQFLHRLQAWWPSTNVAVQTFNPEKEFWVAWAGGRDAAWYQGELRLRKQLGLPPWREHWIARRPVSRTGPTLSQVQAQLNRRRLPGIRIELATQQTHLGKLVERLVVSGPGQPPLRQLLPWQELFPYPWQVDTKPTSWLL